ncbi:MAG: peptide-binding protein [Candidatus Omnitrophica bacterium]|nr:peptide-binding protein [Candidatus Omnitrophota bacterium]
MLRSLKRYLARPLVFLAAFLLPCLFGCSLKSAGIDYAPDNLPANGDCLVTASIADPITLIPIVASDSVSHELCSLLYNGLVRYDKDLNIIGDLCLSWEMSRDGGEITFILRDGVKWHDGAPFTAEDVLFTYQSLIDPKTKTAYSGDFNRIESFRVINPYKIKISYYSPFAPALSSWTMPIIPRHILQNEDLSLTKFARQPVGTGAYKFVKWITGQQIILKANEDYFKKRPYIDYYIYRVIPDPSTMFLELQAGGIDFMGLSPLQYKRQTQNDYFRACFNKYSYSSSGYTYLGYNLRDIKFKDKRVRQALDLAVDKQSIIDGALLGLGRICTGPFLPGSWAYNKDIIPRPRDITAALRLLAQAGWSDTDGDGVIDKDGVDFEFCLLINQGNNLREYAAQMIQQQLKEAGIVMRIKPMEWSVLLGEFINKKKFEAVLMGWGLSPDPDCLDIWHSSKTREGEFNFISYKNEEVDYLFDQGRLIIDRPARARVYHRIHSILHEEQPYMFLWVEDSLPIIHKRFKNIKPSLSGIRHNFTEWYVPEEQQKYGPRQKVLL